MLMNNITPFPSFFLYCTQCYRQQQKQRLLSVKKQSTRRVSRSRPTALATTTTAFLLFLFHALPTVSAQPQPQPTSQLPQVIYTSRYNAGSSIVNNVLYICSGTISMIPPFLATADTLAIPLDATFATTKVPWKRLQAGYFVQDAKVAVSADQKNLVLAGVGDQIGQLVVVYDITENQWAYLSPAAVASVFPRTPRTSVGIALDESTGQMVLYGGTLATGGGGTQTFSMAAEFDLLDTQPGFDKWTWSAAIASSGSPPGLTQPIVLYLPRMKQTLIMGGCSLMNPANGTVGSCVPFGTGYLVNSMVTVANGAPPSVPISTIPLKGAAAGVGIPVPRLSPCTVVLANGDVFMYGGASVNGSLGDSWVLSTTDWTWRMMSIMNLPFPGRAGATCQLATLDQLILVGGFDGGLTGPRQFSEPQVAIINTTSWIWTTTFTPASIASKGQNMSIPVIIKIVITSVILLGVISFIAVKYSRKLWRTYELPKGNDSGTLRNSRSREPLMDDNGSREDFMTGSEASSTPMVPFRAHHYQHTRQHQTHSQQLISNPSHNTINLSTVDLGSSAARASSGVSTKREREREPFLIIPYAPNTNSPSMSLPSTTAYSSDHDNSTPMDSGTLFDTGTGTRTSSGSMKSSDFSMISRKSSDSTFSKGYQLSRTLADIQHGQYVKTLQHQKYYEIRRRDLALQRSGTQYTFDGHDVGEDEGQDLATGVIGLREVDVGEESIKGANDGIEDGTILLSSHLDTTALDTRSL